MGLNIKNPAVETNIRKLAERTGESLTDAIDHAVQEKLERLEKEHEQNKVPQTLEEVLAAIKPMQDEFEEYRRRTGDTRSAEQFMKDFDDEFYDEYGVPK